jgi:hypothetical protein
MSTAMTAVARAVVGVVLVGVIQVRAQQVAPVPAPILSAKKVFIANAGTDALISALDQGKGTRDKYYNVFYGAIKDWGYYTLLDSPLDADLVLEIYASSPVTSVSNGAAKIQPQLQLSILDAKSHFLLWRLTESLDAAHPKLFGGVGGADNKLAEAPDGLLRQLKLLAIPSTGPPRK